MRLRKSLAGFMLAFIVLTNSSLTIAEENKELVKQSIIAKHMLKKEGGEKYISQIDSLVKKFSNNDSKLKIVLERVEVAKLKLANKTDSKSKQVLAILDYLEVRIKIQLEESGVLTKNNEIKEENKVSENDKKIVEKEILKLQKDIFEELNNKFNKISEKFEELSEYEEKGDFSFDLLVDHEEIGKYSGKLEINDFVSKTSGFDSDLKGEIEAIIDALPKGQEQIKIQLKSLFEVIQKDGNLYILMDKLNIEKENTQYIEEILEIFKKIAEQDGYVKFEDKNQALAINMINNFSPKNIKAEGEKYMGKAFFETYKKDGDDYYLIPTRHACSSAKEIANKFDPFNGKTCSDSQYKSLLKDFKESGDLILNIGTDNKLTFVGKEVNGVKINSEIIFNNTEVKVLNFYIVPNQVKYPNDGLSFEFNNKKSLEITLSEKAGNADLNLLGTLDENNRFINLDSNFRFGKSSNEISGNYNIKNKDISGNINIKTKQYKYDYLSGKSSYEDKNDISINISGKNNINNQISECKISYAGKDIKSGNEYLNGSLNIKDSGAFTIKNSTSFEGSNSILNTSGKWNADEMVLEDFDFDLVYNAKKGSFDYETYGYIYEGDFIEIINSHKEIRNGEIKGETKIYDYEGLEIVSVVHSGEHRKDYLKLDNSYKSEYKDPYGMFESLKGNFNFEIDTKNNTNNLDVFFDLNLDDNKVIESNIDYKGTIDYKKLEIKTPSNSVDGNKIFKSKNNYYY